MKLDIKEPPRQFEVGWGEVIRISDCGTIALAPDEQVTFVTPDGGEYDVARKSWGFYATPSLNGRLERFNLRGVLIKNRKDQYFLLLVETGKESLFEDYLRIEGLDIVCWLDNSQALSELERRVKSS